MSKLLCLMYFPLLNSVLISPFSFLFYIISSYSSRDIRDRVSRELGSSHKDITRDIWSEEMKPRRSRMQGRGTRLEGARRFFLEVLEIEIKDS